MGKFHDVTGNLVAGKGEVGSVLRRGIKNTSRGRSAALIREQFVGHSHFDVVGFAGKDFQRFVLRLPPEPRHGAIVPAEVGVPRNSQALLEGGVIKSASQFTQPSVHSSSNLPNLGSLAPRAERASC